MESKELSLREFEIRLGKYKKYYRDIKWLLTTTGIWPDTNPIIQFVYGFSELITITILLAGTVNFSLHHVSDIMVFTRTIGLPFSMISIIMKGYTFMIRREDLKTLNSTLSKQFNEDLNSKKFQSLALYHYPNFGRLFYTITGVLGISGIITCILFPLAALIQGKYMLSVPSIFPFSYENGGLAYWTIQLLWVWVGFIVCAVTSGVDSTFGLYTLQMCGEFRILSHELQQLKGSANYQNDFKRCMQRHVLLIKSRDTVEKIFGFLSIWLAITSAVIQCTMIFQLSEALKTKHVITICHLVAFIMLKLMQAFMYAWYGNLIIEESKMCLDAMYNAAWAGSGHQHFVKDVLIVLSQKPLVFRAKGCMDVTMEMFSKIVNTSISYFFLLQTLKDNSQS